MMARRLLPFYDDSYDAIEHHRMMMESAIQYASYGYRVFPLHTVMVEGTVPVGGVSVRL
jgi:hypothetical protein